ncbi:MAG: hypothetical protein IPL97_12960 [Niastella sp.]|nr:hypothetical protein [Niastella sp.]
MLRLIKWCLWRDMVMQIDPKQEWKQMFNDVWRLERDYFYDANMHGVVE